jgi:hypothetical protein
MYRSERRQGKVSLWKERGVVVEKGRVSVKRDFLRGKEINGIV